MSTPITLVTDDAEEVSEGLAGLEHWELENLGGMEDPGLVGVMEALEAAEALGGAMVACRWIEFPYGGECGKNNQDYANCKMIFYDGDAYQVSHGNSEKGEKKLIITSWFARKFRLLQ